MQTCFRDFEREVIKLLVGDRMPDRRLEDLLDRTKDVHLEHTGMGYFLTVRAPGIAAERVVCSQPLLLGKAGDLECGFVVFLEDGELTLECHSWGDESLPEDFRDGIVEIREAG